MSHIDEGALHAYLDGALDEYPATEAQRVREHLEVCADCRTRLEVERGVREAAGSILAMAAPEVDVPSFEELRAYVKANAPRRTLSLHLYRFGWAASVVLALGTGWMLRGGERVPVMSPDGARAGVPDVSEEVGSTAAEARETADLERDVGASPAGPARLDDAPTTQEFQRAATTAPEREAVLDETRQVSAAAPPAMSRALASAVAADDAPKATDPGADLDAGVTGASSGARSDEVVASSADRLRAEAVADRANASPAPGAPAAEPTTVVPRAPDGAGGGATAEPPRRSAPAEVVTSANQAAPAAGLQAQGRTVEFGDARDAATEEEASISLVVPNVELLEVRFRGTGVRSEGQIAIQRLASGDTLQVIHLPPEIDPSSLDELPPGHREVILQRDAGWIVMRAPVSEATLIELLERLLAER